MGIGKSDRVRQSTAARALRACGRRLGRALTVALALGALATAPGEARAEEPIFCDSFTVGVFNQSFHFFNKGNPQFNEQQHGRTFACRNLYDISPSLRLSGGFGVMSFVNSFDVPSFSLGVDFELQYRPEFLGDFGLLAGVDLGFVHGYQGQTPGEQLYGPFRAAGMLRAGVLYDLPGTDLTVSAAGRYIPNPAGSHFATLSMAVTYRLPGAKSEPLFPRSRYARHGDGGGMFLNPFSQGSF
jgi:hypothetical protein